MSRTFFPVAEFQSRHDKVRAAMDDLGIDLLLVLAPSHVNYLIGTPAKGYQEFQVLFFPREPGPLTLLTRLCEVPLLQAESLAEDIRGWGGREPEDPIVAMWRVMEEKGWLARRIGLEVPDYYLHPYHHQELVAVLGESLVTDATDLIGTVELVKSAAEIEIRARGRRHPRRRHGDLSRLDRGGQDGAPRLGRRPSHPDGFRQRHPVESHELPDRASHRLRARRADGPGAPGG